MSSYGGLWSSGQSLHVAKLFALEAANSILVERFTRDSGVYSVGAFVKLVIYWYQCILRLTIDVSTAMHWIGFFYGAK